MAIYESEVRATVRCPGEVDIYETGNPTPEELAHLNWLRQNLSEFCDRSCPVTLWTLAAEKVGLLAGDRKCIMRFRGGTPGMRQIRDSLGPQGDIEIYK